MRLFEAVRRALARGRIERELDKVEKIDVERLRGPSKLKRLDDKVVKKYVLQKAKEAGVSPGSLYRAVYAALLLGQEPDDVVAEAKRVRESRGKRAADEWLEQYARQVFSE